MCQAGVRSTTQEIAQLEGRKGLGLLILTKVTIGLISMAKIGVNGKIVSTRSVAGGSASCLRVLIHIPVAC